MVFLLVLSTILGRIFDTDPVWLGHRRGAGEAGRAPCRSSSSSRSAFFFVMFQFIGLFWFLSRGGIDTIMPDEIETRFDDVKGQDAALGQLKETLVFLDDPGGHRISRRVRPGRHPALGPPGHGQDADGPGA